MKKKRNTMKLRTTIGKCRIIDPATEAFQAAASTSLGLGSGSSSDIFTVPPGKRAVVEYASVVAQLPVNTGVRATINTTLNSVEVHHHLYSSEVSGVPVTGGGKGL
jgi:hypothetical protein